MLCFISCEFTWPKCNIHINTNAWQNIIANIRSIFAAAVGWLACEPLSNAMKTGLGLGSMAFLMSGLCCSHSLRINNPTILCLRYTTMLLKTGLFLATLIANIVFVATYFQNDTLTKGCSSSDAALAGIILSWILLPMTGFFCFWSTRTYCSS